MIFGVFITTLTVVMLYRLVPHVLGVFLAIRVVLYLSQFL